MLNHWFLTDDIPVALCIPYGHDAVLVIVSYLVAAFAAYTAFHLVAPVRASVSRPARLIWLLTAGLSMGFGVWAMHFIAVLAVEIPIAVRFDLPLTVLSAGFAVVSSAIAFHFITDDSHSRLRFCFAGLILGSGIALMHYLGMAALRMPAHIYYGPWLFTLSVIVAIALATAALFVLSAHSRLQAKRLPLARVMGAAVMGLAIVLMHYTGMLATFFYPDSSIAVKGSIFNPLVMAEAIAVATVVIAGLALMAALMDQRAQRAERLLFEAVNSISEGFVIYDADDRLVMYNDAYRHMFPERLARMVPGIRFEQLIRLGLEAGEFPDATGREEAWIAERVCQHRAARGEEERRLADGRWVLQSERRMRSGGITGLRIDITALKQAQTALRESEERLDRAQEIAGIGSWEIDIGTGRIIWSRQVYRIRGITPRDFDNSTEALPRVINAEDWPRVDAWMADLRNNKAAGPIEYRIMRPDGQERVVVVEGRAIADANGVVVKLAGTVQDITERRHTEQQLVQAQKMETVGQLTGGLAHDFNNILAAVIGNLDLAAEHSPASSPAAEHCMKALDAALSGAEQVKRLLAFSRRQALQPKAIHIEDTIANVLPLVKRALGEQIRIETRLASHLWPAVADRVQLETAILNLTVNARDAMQQGGTLVIAAANEVVEAHLNAPAGDLKPGDYVAISVSDTGAGIPSHLLGRVFEPFFTTKPPGAGSGLGLSMVLGTMQQLGGSVQVSSGVGKGTTVRLYLPRAIVAQETDRNREDTPVPIPTGHEHILLVEDSTPIRELGTAVLQGLGYKVTVAENGDAAMEHIARGERFDLLFTDVVMPGRLNGIALAAALRECDPSVRVLFTSGFASPAALREQVDGLGADLIAKPYRKAELGFLVRSILNRTSEVVA